MSTSHSATAGQDASLSQIAETGDAAIASEETQSVSRRRRVLTGAGWACAHAVLVYHLAAIIISPATVAPASPLERNAYRAIGPYLETINLNHGWHYFAPDPGPSTMLEYEATRADGTVVSGRLPDRSTQPRLLYHRYFMLTEAQPFPDEWGTPQSVEYHHCLADGIGKKFGAERVTLRRVTHLVPTAQAVRAGFPLDDPAQYVVTDIDTFDVRRPEDLMSPETPSSAGPEVAAR